MGCNALFAAVPPAIRPDAKIETRIEKILGRLTLEEKIGQMCQLTVSMVTDMNDSGHPFISDELLDTVIGHYKVGSILNVPFDEAQSREAWTQIIGRIQRRSLDCLGIPCIYGVDQMHGASYTRGATFFPQGINMGAALNCELMRRSSEISAYETRACAIPWNFAPVMDLGRDPRWSRMWESYGEDVCVNSRLAAASVRGLQGDDPNRIGIVRASIRNPSWVSSKRTATTARAAATDPRKGRFRGHRFVRCPLFLQKAALLYPIQNVIKQA